MKFFTKKWHKGEYGDLKSERVVEKYEQHRKKILNRFPKKFINFCTTENLHDSLISSCAIDISNKTLLLDLICGDNQRGYFKIQLSYSDVDLKGFDLPEIRRLVEENRTELINDEIDIFKEHFIHRMLFWPQYIEIKVCFKEFDFQKLKVKSRFSAVIGTKNPSEKEGAVPKTGAH